MIPPCAGVAGLSHHAPWHGVPVAAGGACGDFGADGLGAAAVLPLLPVCAP